MAYDKKNLGGHVGTGAGVPSLYLYSTDDTAAVVEAANYFNDSADIFEVNDLIVSSPSDKFAVYRVSANDGVTVTIVTQEKEA